MPSSSLSPSPSDLEFLHLNLAPLKLPQLPCANGGPEPEGTSAIRIPESESSQEDGCRTPTSEEHRIPEPKTCPPAPRKRSCKRRRSNDIPEVGSFKAAVSHREVEEFFREVTDAAGDQKRIRVVVRGDCQRKKSVLLQFR